MKRGLFIGAFILFFLVNFVTAQSCDDDQVILKLSSTTNAHGEVSNGAGNYPEKVCYDQIFGQAYDTNIDPDYRICNGANSVLRLSDSTNAHAEDPTGTYSTEICYGDLSCRLDSSGTCNTDEQILVRLSSSTNAHLEIRIESNYNNVICCSNTGVPIERAYWANNNGNELANEIEVNLDTQIQLLAQGVSSGTTVDYAIYDTDCLLYALDISCSDRIGSLSLSVDSDAGGIARLNYQLTLPNIAGDDDNEDKLELFFIATTIDGFSQKSNRIDLLKQIVPVEQGCVQFDEVNECNNAPESVWGIDEANIEQSAGKIGGVGCGNTDDNGNEIDCSCFWNVTDSQCEFRYVKIPLPLPPIIGDDPRCLAGCNIFSDYGQCVENSLGITYITSYVPEPGCTGSVYEIPDDKIECEDLDKQTIEISCGLSPELILPFFDKWGFMVSIFIIGIIYLFLSKKERDN